MDFCISKFIFFNISHGLIHLGGFNHYPSFLFLLSFASSIPFTTSSSPRRWEERRNRIGSKLNEEMSQCMRGENPERKDRLVAVGVDKDKYSLQALHWAVDNFLTRGQTLRLVHVLQKPINPLQGNQCSSYKFYVFFFFKLNYYFGILKVLNWNFIILRGVKVQLYYYIYNFRALEGLKWNFIIFGGTRS